MYLDCNDENNVPEDLRYAMSKMKVEDYKPLILSYVEEIEKDTLGFVRKDYQKKVTILAKKLRSLCAKDYYQALAEDDDPWKVTRAVLFEKLAKLGHPEGCLIFVKEELGMFYTRKDYIRLLEDARKIGFTSSADLETANKLLGRLWWEEGKALVDAGKEKEGLALIQKAEPYCYNARSFLLQRNARHDDFPDIDYSKDPFSDPFLRQTAFRHYASNEKVFESQGEYLSESGEKLSFWKLD